jgi:Coenzyme PQQ synthesis protein D (PqqD)
MAEKQLRVNSLVRHTSDVFWQDVVEDVVILSMENAHYFGAEGTGAEIWRLLEKPIKIEDICASLVENYEIDRQTCEAEVLAFIEELNAAGLIELVSS